MAKLEILEIYDRETCNRYINHLINKTYKILPLKEDNSPTLESYLESYLLELKGFKLFKDLMHEEPRIMSMLNIIESLKDDDYSNEVCRKEVFRCIRILNKLNEKYFSDEV